MNTLTTYLRKYYDMHDKILLVYRPDLKHGWSNRTFYLDDTYNPSVPYNHRTMLPQEVVFEYDGGNPEENRKFVDTISARLTKDGITWAKWSSGNKSVHLHTFINPEKATNISLLKKAFIRTYCIGLPIPDLQLCGDNHLIRAEYGVHEKTGRHKELISKNGNYPSLNKIPKAVWDKYTSESTRILNMRVTKDLNEFETLPGVRLLLQTEEFKKANDGRERAMLLLIKVLKQKYNREELKTYMTSWYHYVGGTKLIPAQIHKKVDYYWDKNYSMHWYQEYLDELLESIGRNDLVKRNEVQKSLS